MRDHVPKNGQTTKWITTFMSDDTDNNQVAGTV